MKTVERKYSPQTWKSELRCATGRSAIRHLLHVARPACVLMPAYVPEGVINPVKDAGIPIVHYWLLNDLSPDIRDLQQRLESEKSALVIVVDYFGVEMVTPKIRDMCDAAGAMLLEDCAHAYWADAEHADFALWSLNKIFPVPDGAVLRSRRYDADVDWYLCQNDSKAVALYREHLRLHSMGLHCAADVVYEKYYDRISSVFVPCEQSQESKLLAGDAKYISEEADARFWNWHGYSLLVPPEFRVYETVGSVSAFAYPILCPHGCRDKIKEDLKSLGVRAAICRDKWDHVPEGTAFTYERDFMARHLLLPVGGDVTREDVGRISDCLQQYAEKAEA